MAKKLTAAQIKSKMSNLSPRVSGGGTSKSAARADLAKAIEKETGGSMSHNGGLHKQANDSGGGAYFTVPMPFQPEFGDPSKIHYPIDRHQQNRYWRLIFKTDPIIGSVIDMFAEMLCSNVELTGEGVTGEIKRSYEDMINSTKILSLFQYFIKEFLVVGEVIPHLIFDERKGIWTDILFHNPDQVNVLSSPFMNMEPVLEFMPDESLRNFANSKNPQVLEYLSNIPDDILSSILTGNNIPLNTKMNVSFIARKLFPYDVRGSSIIPRVWQIYMYETSVYNAAIATARRHAGPVKVVKMGHPEGHWLPNEADFDEFLKKITFAEQDPHSWIMSHPFVNFEAWGTTDRMLSISREYDLIERVKLTALGVSQGFLHGDATYASSKTSMNSLMMRLRGMRVFFENIWWYPKFFKPIAEINQWIKPTAAEVSHRFKKKRTAQEAMDEGRLIIPKLRWSQQLEPAVDKELLEAVRLLNDLGVKASKSTSFAAAGMDFEEETANVFIEQKMEKEIRDKILPEESEREKSLEEEITAPGGGGGGFSMPEELGTEEGVPGGPPSAETPEGEEVSVPEGKEPAEERPTEVAPASKRGFNFTANDIEDLIDLMETGKTDSQIWASLRTKDESIGDFINGLSWDRIDDYMVDEGFNDTEIEHVRKSLVRKDIIDAELRDKLDNAVELIETAVLMDDQMSAKIDGLLDKSIKKKLKKATALVNERAANKQGEFDSFLTGDGNSIHTEGGFVGLRGIDMNKKKIANYRRKKTIKEKKQK